MATQEQLDAIGAQIGAPRRVRNDQGEVEMPDLLTQVRALRELTKLQSGALAPSKRPALFGSLCNKLSPPGLT